MEKGTRNWREDHGNGGRKTEKEKKTRRKRKQEKDIIGKHTFHPETASLPHGNVLVEDKRTRLIELCISPKMILANTWFQKRTLRQYLTWT